MTEAPSALMGRALMLVALGRGKASPGPAVGCVIARGEEVVGEGYYTGPPGSPHAEVIALRQAGAAARGATAYVTLEPCSHHGRTPPCTGALIEAGVGRVVYAIIDPDARVSGSGKAALAAAGVAVAEGDGAAESARLLEAYIKHRRTGLPFVVVKYAASLDGRIAAASGDSRWVSGPETRRWAHAMRTQIDAILVGASTVVVDDPQLTGRGRRPLRQAQGRPLRQAQGRPLRQAQGRPLRQAQGRPLRQAQGRPLRQAGRQAGRPSAQGRSLRQAQGRLSRWSASRCASSSTAAAGSARRRTC